MRKSQTFKGRTPQAEGEELQRPQDRKLRDMFELHQGNHYNSIMVKRGKKFWKIGGWQIPYKPGTEFGFYFEYNGKALEDFKQGNDSIGFIALETTLVALRWIDYGEPRAKAGQPVGEPSRWDVGGWDLKKENKWRNLRYILKLEPIRLILINSVCRWNCFPKSQFKFT